MADLTIVSSVVIPGANATIVALTAGVALAAGDVVYKDSADNFKAKLADADSATAAARVVLGICVNSAAANQRVNVVTEDDDLTLISTGLTPGDVLILSATAGKIAPVGDLVNGMYNTVLGVAKSASKVVFRPLACGVVKA